MSRCIGCGVKLQKVDKNMDGYITDIEDNICQRCFNIKNYGKNALVNKNNIDYMNILNNIKEDDLVIYVSSLLTLNLDYINKFNKVILVLTKRDILPKSVKDGKIINYIKSRYSNILDVVIVSAYKKYNLDLLYNMIGKYNDGKNIYFVGITNSGKSTLVNEMMKSYSGIKGEITTSNFPSTTLGVVLVHIGKFRVKDTPGIVINNSVINYMDNSEIKLINSKKEIKPVTFQLKEKGVILVNELIKIEYITDVSSMTFYVSNNLKVERISINNKANVFEFSREFDVASNQDLVIEDIGFIKFTRPLKIKVCTKNNIYMYLRDNLI